MVHSFNKKLEGNEKETFSTSEPLWINLAIFFIPSPTASSTQGPFLGTNLRVTRVQMRGTGGTAAPSRGRLRIWEPSGLSRQQASVAWGLETLEICNGLEAGYTYLKVSTANSNLEITWKISMICRTMKKWKKYNSLPNSKTFLRPFKNHNNIDNELITCQALGGYLRAAQVVLVCVDASEAVAEKDARRVLADVAEAGEVAVKMKTLSYLGPRGPRCTSKPCFFVVWCPKVFLAVSCRLQSMRPGTIVGLCGLQVVPWTMLDVRSIAAHTAPNPRSLRFSHNCLHMFTCMHACFALLCV